jgi:hypothetical protein
VHLGLQAHYQMYEVAGASCGRFLPPKATPD